MKQSINKDLNIFLKDNFNIIWDSNSEKFKNIKAQQKLGTAIKECVKQVTEDEKITT